MVGPEYTEVNDLLGSLRDSAKRVLPTDVDRKKFFDGIIAKGILDMLRNGRRREEAFVDLNCAGLSKEFLESELFGHQKGAFTGAVQDKQGLLDLAQLYPEYRIPECIGGYARAERPTPGAYPQANTPQLWNATAFPLVVQTILGLQPVAPLHLLVVSPALTVRPGSAMPSKFRFENTFLVPGPEPDSP